MPSASSRSGTKYALRKGGGNDIYWIVFGAKGWEAQWVQNPNPGVLSP